MKSRGQALPLAMIVLGAGIALLGWESIRIPYHNPLEVVGPHSILGTSPADDRVRFFLLVLSPVFLLLLTYFARRGWLSHSLEKISTPPSPVSTATRPSTIVVILLFLVTILGALVIPIEVAEGRLDTFHEGESLGPATLVQNGAIPYKDFVVAHGAFQDPLRSLLAFRLFGESIAATRTLQSLLKIASFALLALLLLLLFPKRPYRALSVLVGFLLLNLLPAPFSGGARSYPWVYPAIRDAATYGSLVALLAAYRWSGANESRRFHTNAAFFAAAFLPIASFGFSTDRGLFALVAYALLAPMLYLARCQVAGTGGVRRFSRSRFIVSSILGLTAGALVTAFAMRGAVLEFVEFTFFEQPAYWGLLTGRSYSLSNPLFVVPLLLAATNMFVIVLCLLRQVHQGRNLVEGLRSFLEDHFGEVALLVSSLLTFQTALGRSDAYHVGIGSGLTYLLTLVLLARLPGPGRDATQARRRHGTLVAAAVLLVYLGLTILTQDRLRANFPLGTPDSTIVPRGYRDAATFLKDNLAEDEFFYPMTSEGIWYYLTGKSCPTRFPALYYAAPRPYQEEVVRDLETGNVKFVIVNNGSFATSIDGISLGARFPLVVRYVSTHYRPHTRIADHEIWIRRQLPAPGPD